MAASPKAKRGRPPLKAAERRRHVLSIRLRDENRKKLEELAALSERSVSEEVEVRLERSFQSQSLRREVLEMMFGQRGAALAFMIGLAAREIGAAIGPDGPENAWDVGNWIDDPTAFDEIAQAINTIVEGLRPEGEPVKPNDGYRLGFERGRNALISAKTHKGNDTHELLGAAAERIKVPEPQPRGYQKRY